MVPNKVGVDRFPPAVPRNFPNLPVETGPRFAFATLEDYTTPVRHFMRSGGSGLVVAACALPRL